MRAALVLLAGLGLALAAAAGAARPERTDRGELLLGTRAADVLVARGGADRVVAWGDGRRDTVLCGPGADLVNAERNDRVGGDCETVVRQLARDATTAPGAQHGTLAEPDSEAAGRTVVTVFQSGRYRSGGAAAIGFATSRDAGVSWVEGLLPPSPRHGRQSDPVVAYDAMRGAWLASTLGIGAGGATALLLYRSSDGIRWQGPAEAAAAEGSGGGFDKQWLVCDGGVASPFRGRCYLAYTDLTTAAIALRSSPDGGVTWSQPAHGPPSTRGAVGAYPVVRPNGDLLVLYTDADAGITVLRSTDGAASLVRAERLAPLASAAPQRLRAPVLVAADADTQGRVVAVWQGCSLRRACDGNDVLFAESPDGVSWSAPRALPTRSTGNAFAPTVAVEPATGRLAVLYYAATGCPACRVDAWVLESADGRRWTAPLRLSARGSRPEWMPQTTQGAMLADYVSISWVAGRPLAVVALAEEPLPGGRLRQAIFAASRLDPLRAVRSRRDARRS